MPGRASNLCQYIFACLDVDPELLTIFRIVHNNTSATSMSELNLKSRIETVSLGANLIATRFEAVEELTDMIVSLVFLVGKLRI